MSQRTRLPLRTAVGLYTGMTVLGLGLNRLQDAPLQPAPVLHGVLAGLGGAAALVLAARLSLYSDRMRQVSASLGRAVGPLTPARRVTLAALSGVGEETLFRAGLQPLIGFWPATLLFAVLHSDPTAPRRMWPWTASALMGGLVFAGLYQRFGLLAAICAHAGTNFMTLPIVAKLADPAQPQGVSSESGRGAGRPSGSG